MFEILRELCCLDATSGNEDAVKNYIIEKIAPYCEYRVDNLGNIIAFKKGEKTPEKRLVIDAHMDEVGLIITSVTDGGFLKFKTVGGIDTAVLMSRKVIINGEIPGVITAKPIHLLEKDEAKKLPKADSLCIDIGANSKDAAQEKISLGDRAVIASDYIEAGDKILSKALDDRIGCAVLITLLKEDSEYDFYATFSVQEEVGLRGARTAVFAVNPDSAIVVEATTAADIADVPSEKRVCVQGEGAVISFMDNATVYDRKYYNAALNSGIKCQPKSAVTGGNNSGAIHLNREGVRTVSVSVPCRYIHSASSVADKGDIQSVLDMVRELKNGILGGKYD